VDRVLKWLWLPLLLVLLASPAYLITGNWDSISTVAMIDRGGYLHGDDGEVVGLWDGWSTEDLPAWLVPIAIPFYLVMSSPLWFRLLYPIVGFILLYLYILPYICNRGKVGG